MEEITNCFKTFEKLILEIIASSTLLKSYYWLWGLFVFSFGSPLVYRFWWDDLLHFLPDDSSPAMMLNITSGNYLKNIMQIACTPETFNSRKIMNGLPSLTILAFLLLLRFFEGASHYMQRFNHPGSNQCMAGHFTGHYGCTSSN